MHIRKTIRKIAVLTTMGIIVAACLPVPIGDPERSKVSDQYSGTWISVSADDCLYVTTLKPYDKRTWLVGWYCVDLEGDGWKEIQSAESYASIIALLDEVDPDGVELAVMKAWTVKLGGKMFMTWEPRLFADSTKEPFWYVWQIDQPAENTLTARLIDGEYSKFEDIPDDKISRRRYESIIRKNSSDEELYDTPTIVHFKVPDEDLGLIENLVDNAAIADW
jgi:hypothetical protein